MRYILFIKGTFILMLLAGSLAAGGTGTENGDSLGRACTSISTEKIMILKSSWSGSSNASALSYYDCGNRLAKAKIGYDHYTGDYSLFQEPQATDRYGFYTSGYSKLGRWGFYGNFNYYNETSTSVRWVDVMEPYDGNPYTVGDSVGGDYWREYYLMEARASCLLTENLSLGFDIRYRGGVGTKRKDPRPENSLTDFAFSPAMIWHTGRYKLGASFHVESGKEDIEFDAVNDRKNDLFYFRGLGAFSSTVEEDGRYSNKILFGGGIQCNVKGDELDNLTAFHYSRQTTDIKRGDTYPLQVVLLDHYFSEASSVFLFRPEEKNVNRLSLQYKQVKSYGEEPVVEPKLEEVSWQWSTAAKYSLYWQSGHEWGIGYSFYKVKDIHHFIWGTTITGKYSIDETTYYFVPEFNRQNIAQLSLDASFDKSFVSGRNQLVLSVNAVLRNSPSHSLQIVDDVKLKENIQLDFLQHDFDYLVARRREMAVTADYGRDIRLNKYPFQFFLEAGFRRITADFKGQTGRNILQINAGINF